MRWFLASLIVVGVGLGTAWLVRGDGSQLPAVPDGDREIAFIHAATSVSAWERFVTGVNRVSRDWPAVHVDDANAFPEATTATPELVLTLDGAPGRLRIRWYKLSKDANAAEWAGRLGRRDPSPLAIIGGGSTDRAVDLATALANQTNWLGDRPLLFITTATASSIGDVLTPTNLMNVYAGRSFRMCFTNEQIASAVVDFVLSQPDLKPSTNPPIVSALRWDDDPYSVDLANQFHKVFHESPLGPTLVYETRPVPFSVGGQYSPNAWEAQAADRLVAQLSAAPAGRQVLVLPTVAAPARRVLRTLTGGLPLVGRNLVVLTGDSINLNNVYRDADIGWNVRALAVPLVFFAHQNPVGWDRPPADEDRTWPAVRPTAVPTVNESEPYFAAPPTNTDEVFLHRDLVKLLVESAYGASNKLAGGADELADRIRSRQPAVFGPTGDRLGGRGEHILVLRPHFAEATGTTLNQVQDTATLEVWTRSNDTNPTKSRWTPVKRLTLNHAADQRTHP